MCLSPIQIINPSKYISLEYRDRYILNVPCGHCAECQQTLSNQWFLRAWVECTNYMDDNSFLYFDTLTYDDAHLPHMDDIVSDLPHISCFRPKDIRLFIESLRICLRRKYEGVEFKYFLASEYGSVKYTARPHYHILFWCRGDIEPLELSSMINNYWQNGRTDGVPWHSSSYVEKHNVIRSNGTPENYLRACRYVTKYVQKSCLFDKTLNDRLILAMNSIAKKMPDDKWLDSVNAQRVRTKLKRSINLFHRQSKHFGESLLESIDFATLFETGCVIMPSPKGVKIPVPLSTYYKRKLFYDLCVVDGNKTWQLNQFGKQYQEYRQKKLLQDLADSFYSYSVTFKLNYSKEDCIALADYVYNFQGRIIADKMPVRLEEKLSSVELYNYVTQSDKEHLSDVGLVSYFIGNNTIGYNVSVLPSSHMTIKQFIANHVYYDEEKEKQLNEIYFRLSKLNSSIQEGFELKQRLKDVYKFVNETMRL